MTDPAGDRFVPRRESVYTGAGYDYRGRFISYWSQAREVLAQTESSSSVLEIGPGNYFLVDYLARRGLAVETLDIDAVHGPDHVGSVEDIPLPDRSFDVVTCFEVLEHLPFELVPRALREMGRVSRRAVLFSVPDVRYFLELDLALFSSRRRFQYLASFPRLTNRKLRPPRPGGHQWEIGRPGFPVARVAGAIPPELRLVRDYRIQGNPMHHMFVAMVGE